MEWWFVSREYVEDGVRLLREEGKDELARSLLTFHYLFLQNREPKDILIGYLIRDRVRALIIYGVDGREPVAKLIDIEEWLAPYYDDPIDP
jgi:hypothetical protein